MRTPLIAGNWKMFKTVREAVAFVSDLRPRLSDVAGVDVLVAPTFPALQAVAGALDGSAIHVAAQNIHWERDGAFTGEVSAAMVRDAGAAWVIIGHSERRTLFGETDETVNRKTRAAISATLTPIVCIGETLQEREANRTLEVLDRQIKGGFDGVTGSELAALVIAYEPVWAIGTGRTATPAQAQEAHAHIRARLTQWFGHDAASRCRILYGGSVKPDNIAALMAQSDVDGALVGGASLDAESFAKIVKGSRA
ncbi:MAG TPA: triose-phosphate isomerase [Vicinamibacterales bacterium]|jgi:triosephosphate isomerase|nr:triose-phosphate isomerase [Vicinamibacterales bacterium]